MASLTVRNLDSETKSRLRIRAAHHGRSMEDEVRDILRSALASNDESPPDLAARIRNRFSSIGGVELEIPEREPTREPPDLSR